MLPLSRSSGRALLPCCTAARLGFHVSAGGLLRLGGGSRVDHPPFQGSICGYGVVGMLHCKLTLFGVLHGTR